MLYSCQCEMASRCLLAQKEWRPSTTKALAASIRSRLPSLSIHPWRR